MKKFFTILFLSFFISALPTVAATTDWTSSSNTARINTIGKKILSANDLPDIDFTVIDSEEVNAFTDGTKIYVYTGLLQYVTDDSELAGIIAHETGHILNSHVAKQSIISSLSNSALNILQYLGIIKGKVATGAGAINNLSMLKMSRTQEYEADITSVDLISKAGYNPLAMVSVIYKITDSYFDLIQTHPSGDKRTMYIYDYITYNYPDKIKEGYNSTSYKRFLTYAEPIVTERNSSPSKLKSFNDKQAKLRQTRLKKAAQYKNYAQNGWQKLLRAVSTT